MAGGLKTDQSDLQGEYDNDKKSGGTPNTKHK
jgi:hypothetical protein